MNGEHTMKIIGIFILEIILAIVAACLCLFLPQNPKDYSYLENYPTAQRLELSDEVKVENLDELYYTYETDFHGNPTQFYIHDKFENKYGEGRFIFSYQNMQLNFDYEIEIVEIGSAHNPDGEDTASLLRIISLDDWITGSMLVRIGTEEMLTTARAEGMYWWFLIGCGGISLVVAVALALIIKKGVFEVSEVTVQKVKYNGSLKKRIQKDFDLYKSANDVYKEFLDGRLSQVLTLNNEGSKDGSDIEEEWVTTVKKRRLKIHWDNLFNNILRFFLSFVSNAGFLSAVATFFFGAVAGWAWFSLIPLAIAIIDVIFLFRII